MNAVYFAELDKWIRLDARGNKVGINARFSAEQEILAFPVRTEKGELDVLDIFSKPATNVIDILTRNETRTQLFADLPTELMW